MGLKEQYRLSGYCVMTALMVVASIPGCSTSVNPEDAVAASNSNNIQRVANLYLAYQTENNWIGPPDEAAFKDFIRGLSPNILSRISVDPTKLDQVFVSDRDNQPFKIRYKVVGNMRGSGEPVVYESEGVDDKRMVGFLNNSQREVDAAEYDSLFAKGTAGAAPQQ
jgi:hypothetical protein